MNPQCVFFMFLCNFTDRWSCHQLVYDAASDTMTCTACHSMKFVCSFIYNIWSQFTFILWKRPAKNTLSIFNSICSFNPRKNIMFWSTAIDNSVDNYHFRHKRETQRYKFLPIFNTTDFRKPARIRPHGEDYVISQRNSLLTEAMVR